MTYNPIAIRKRESKKGIRINAEPMKFIKSTYRSSKNEDLNIKKKDVVKKSEMPEMYNFIPMDFILLNGLKEFGFV